MNLPSNKEVELALINLLISKPNQEMHLADVYQPLADYFDLTAEQINTTYAEEKGVALAEWEGLDTPWKVRVRTANKALKNKGIIWKNPRKGKTRGIVKLISLPEGFLKDTDLFDEMNQTPQAYDIEDYGQPDKIKVSTYRILRDTLLARKVKIRHNYRCQICNETIQLPTGKFYAEAHHIRPLGQPHNGPDIEANIICLCPNHHVLLDYGVIPLDLSTLELRGKHRISKEFVEYHNQKIYRKYRHKK